MVFMENIVKSCGVISLLSILTIYAFDPEPCHAEEPMILAAYQAWFGLPSHLPVYKLCEPDLTSCDSALLARQIQKAKGMGIAGFVVDWYGPKAGVANDLDRYEMGSD
jgi:hypothetical protein